MIKQEVFMDIISLHRQSLKTSLCLKLGAVCFPLFDLAHGGPFIIMAYSLNYCLEIGVHYRDVPSSCTTT